MSLRLTDVLVVVVVLFDVVAKVTCEESSAVGQPLACLKTRFVGLEGIQPCARPAW